jgi:hypothetical protein
MRYLLITFFRKPGGQIDEQVGFSKKVRPVDMQTCNVILDYKEKKVLKCYIDGKIVPTDFERMHAYYSEIYPELVAHLAKTGASDGE